jgi:spore germination protein
MIEPNMAAQPSLVRRRSARRIWLVAGALTLLLLSVAYGSFEIGVRSGPVPLWDPIAVRAYLNRPLDTTSPSAGFWVTGYYVDYDRTSLNTVKTSAQHMDQIILFGYGFDRQGALLGEPQSLIKGITGPTKRVLLFANLTNGAFDKETAHLILTDAAVGDRAVNNIVRAATDLGVAGVQIDFEDMAPEDRDAYTAFLRRLAHELHQRELTLSIAAPAKTSDSHTGWGGAIDYVAIGQIVDTMYIMAYDEHWVGGEPGPIASLGWTERVIRYATGVMPAQKVVLGLPFYGYEWTADPKGDVKSNRSYSTLRMRQRLAEVGATAKWDPVVGENVATYKTAAGERIAWFPDERSLDAKLKLAYQYNLRGVAVWRLGFEPDDWWGQLGSFRLHPAKP